MSTVNGGEPITESSPLTERLTYAKVGIVGPTGHGKSYLTKTMDIETTGYINMERKPLPYRQTQPFRYMTMPKTWASYKQALIDYGGLSDKAEIQEKAKPIKRIVLDSQTMAFATLNKEMNINFSGFDVYKNYNRQVYEYLEILKSVEKDVLIFSHDEIVKLDEGSKKKMMSVHGKEFEGKIEQHFTIVLFTGTRLKEGKPTYFLRTFEQDASTKVPEGMFPDKNGDNLLEIPNDGKYILDCVESYYTIPVKK